MRRIEEEDWERYLALRERYPLAARLSGLSLYNPAKLRMMSEDEPRLVDRMVEQTVEMKTGPASNEEERSRVRRMEYERLDQVRNEVDTSGLGYRLRRGWKSLRTSLGPR